MSRIIVASLMCVSLILPAYAQKTGISLAFTAVEDTSFLQLDSIRIMNRTQGFDTVLYWPDTVLSIYNVGVEERSDAASDFRILQCYPNPFKEMATISFRVPQRGNVCFTMSDLPGIAILHRDYLCERGIHTIRFFAGNPGEYVINARWRDKQSSLKVIGFGASGHSECLMEYSGHADGGILPEAKRDIQDFYFSMGDRLLLIGYAGGQESGIPDQPSENKSYVFQFATNKACRAHPTVSYAGQTYNTIQVYSQCWLKENLNVGKMIQGGQEMTNNGEVEKYCYLNRADSCNKYGGLYQWHEMMQYATREGVEGICPPGWRLPADEDWKVLEGAVDSIYGMGDPEWDINYAYRGTNAGTSLKSGTGWHNDGNGTDKYGFSAFPAGDRRYTGYFYDQGEVGFFWTSTAYHPDYAWYRSLSCYLPESNRNYFWEGSVLNGFSVRCLRYGE